MFDNFSRYEHVLKDVARPSQQLGLTVLYFRVPFGGGPMAATNKQKEYNANS